MCRPTRSLGCGDTAQRKDEQGVVACWMPRFGLQVQEGVLQKEAA